MDQFGQPLASQPTFNWTLVSGPGTLTGGGLYTPPYASGSATVMAASGGYSAQATVTFSSEAQWSATASSLWSSSGNWKDALTSTTLSAPGVRGVNGDTTLFTSAALSTVTLDGVSPFLAGITFDNAAENYTIAQGSGGNLSLQAAAALGPSCKCKRETTPSPLRLCSTATSSSMPPRGAASTVSGPVNGNSNSISVTGPGTVVLSGTGNNDISSVAVTSAS